MSNSPLVTLAASWLVGVRASDNRVSSPTQTVAEVVPVSILEAGKVPLVIIEAASSLVHDKASSVPSALVVRSFPLLLVSLGQ